jgi:hypothetical protein
VATVTHQGPCSNGTCTVDVVYSAGGRQVTAVMYGVPSRRGLRFPLASAQHHLRLRR